MARRSRAEATVVFDAKAAAQWVPIDAVERWARNPRRIDRAATEEAKTSLVRFGFCAAAVGWGSKRRLVAGHARLRGLDELLAADPTLERPEHRKLRDSLTGPTLRHIPLRVREFESEEEANAYALRDNNAIGAWDPGALSALLKEQEAAGLDVSGLGFSEKELLRLGIGEPPPGRGGPDDVPPASRTAISKAGEVYELGPHRVFCGSSTELASWDAVLMGEAAHVLWTDPPYGVAYASKREDGSERHDRIANDDLEDDALQQLVQLSVGRFITRAVPGAAIYVAAPSGPQGLPFALALRALGCFRQKLAWVKSSLVLGHSDYHYRHEDIYFGYSPGFEGRRGRGGSGWYGDDAQDSVLEVDKPSRSEEHPTMKPVELILRCLRNSARPGDVVCDAFGGSGSTLIAAAERGCRARLIELAPNYVDVIRRRWTKYALAASIDPGPGRLD